MGRPDQTDSLRSTIRRLVCRRPRQRTCPAFSFFEKSIFQQVTSYHLTRPKRVDMVRCVYLMFQDTCPFGHRRVPLGLQVVMFAFDWFT